MGVCRLHPASAASRIWESGGRQNVAGGGSSRRSRRWEPPVTHENDMEPCSAWGAAEDAEGRQIGRGRKPEAMSGGSVCVHIFSFLFHRFLLSPILLGQFGLLWRLFWGPLRCRICFYTFQEKTIKSFQWKSLAYLQNSVKLSLRLHNEVFWVVFYAYYTTKQWFM